MKTLVFASLGCLALAAGFTDSASAQWFDDFDTYAPGDINGLTTGGPQALGTWQGWFGDPSVTGDVVTPLAFSAPNSQEIFGNTDSVHRFQGVTAGAWTFTAKQFIPVGFTGNTYFILNNVYNDANSPAIEWAVELNFNGTTGFVTDDFRAGASIALTPGAWADIRVDFDLTLDTISQYYNGLLISTGTWSNANGATLALGAVDLWADGGSDPVYYDNMGLVPAPGSVALLGLGGLMAGRRRRA